MKINKTIIHFVLCLSVILAIFCSCNSTEDDWESRYNSYSHSSSVSYESPSQVLKFSNIELENNSSYTVCTGSITNRGTQTYYFVKIKGSFTDYSGTVIDTDWTYAVGSEGLAPGETKTFRMSVEKDHDIRKCNIKIIDYDT